MSIVEPFKRRLKSDILTETKCKIRFIYEGFNCNRKKWGKKWMDIKGGGRGLTPNGKCHFKFPFFNPSLNNKHDAGWPTANAYHPCCCALKQDRLHFS